MPDFSTLINRNHAFTENYKGNLPTSPRIPTLVLTCMDARVDPAHFLGLQLGDSPVLRTGGARITRDVEIQIAVLFMLVKQIQGDDFGGISVAIIHHTNCGYERLATPEFRALLTGQLNMDDAELQTLGISDHTQAINDDIERLKQSSCVPKNVSVTGYIYDVQSGELTELVPEVKLDAVQK
ncbi:MAG: carbonic anhydrase [Aggregatilineales bacterium]